MRLVRISFLLVTSAFLALAFVPGGSTTTADEYANTVTAADLKRHLDILASDAYMGRETGTEGQRMAADYIAAQFRSFGIPELPQGTYFQNYPLVKKTPGAGTITVSGKKFVFKKDFFYLGGTSDASLHNSVVEFVGFGISDSAWNDYTAVDTNFYRGKVLVALDGEPYGKDSLSKITGKKTSSGWSSDRRRKIIRAREKGALALLLVVPDIDQSYKQFQHLAESPTVRLDDGRKEDPVAPLFFVSAHLGDTLLKTGGTKQTTVQLRKKMESKGKTMNLAVKPQLNIDVIRPGEKLNASNVLGFLEGSDLKNEIIVVTAHYDHLGKDAAGVVYNGADDDGSGTVSVIEIAEAFAKAKKEGHGPRRSVLFMTVSGEEKGLLGSDYYVNHPVFPLEKTICDLNIDMIGRVDEKHASDSNYVYVIGSGMLSSGLQAVSEKAAKEKSTLKLDYTFDDPKDKNRFYYRSDHYNFAKNKIPVAFYFNGVHADYHKETDEVSKINFALMEKRARLVFYTAWDLANRDEKIVVDRQPK